MKTKFHVTLIATLLLLCATLAPGCASTPDSRIKKNQQLFDSLPPQTQTAIRAGNIAPGFTPDMVLLALGQPDRRYPRTTQTASSEVWAYAAPKSPSFTFGLGIGGSIGRGIAPGVSTGIGIATGSNDRADDRIRVIFDNDKVTSIEQATPAR